MTLQSASTVPQSHATNDESSLRERAREAIRAGRLPSRPPARVWGGRGTGARCAICAEPVGPEQVELEVELARGAESEPGEVELHHVHARCFAAWESEARGPEAALGGGPLQSGAVLSGEGEDATLRVREDEAAGKRGAP